jgi:translation initiation factor IF-3
MLHSRGKRFKSDNKKFFYINEMIRIPKVQVIDENNQPLGIMNTADALQLAKEKELDLIEVNPKGEPPVCKILDFGQFQYQQSRKVQQQKAHAKKIEVKGIRISYKIDKHDLDFRKNQAIKFLSKGDKVRVETILRGRERQYANLAMEKMQEFISSMGDINLEQPIKKLGNQLSAIIAPLKK